MFLNIACKKNVSNNDWWREAIKYGEDLGIFSIPLTLIFTERKQYKQNLIQWPNILPPKRATFWGKISAGKKTKQIRTVPT